MADQTSNQSASPSTTDQVAMQEAAFLAASRRLVAQAHTVPRLAGRDQRNPLAGRPPVFKRGGSTESMPMPTLAISTESVVNQPLPTEEEAAVVADEPLKDGVVVVEEVVVEEEEKENDVLVPETQEVTIIAEIYDEPPRREEEKIKVEEAKEAEVALVMPEIAMEEVAGHAWPEEVEKEDKKKKNKGKKAEEAEYSHHHKARKIKEKKDNDKDEEAKKERKKKEKEERKLRRREKRRLREEEEAKWRVASPDGESTSVREDRGETVQLMEPT
ncbi:translation initiation factor IF-2-like [Benincasa hispida]|uniref:translation initiation factor IF-2-like n=1 Tax=Benincasa hispida TaxID=102211 RepID=UPI001900AC5B|nr:translation initiation factor IF-2-like [Benincasa hispida]